ncbi:UvrD-helicase-domain-containing protein [Aspergillus heteromorphus CBS 117.55]|uniref:UvrD-helicase-domain-containing protein n=1 Tax=Aspergillus heteromorphus CBS 117.55 TaxID=1448321 RepID=A0A317WXQ8_9EURO|nr:UvrD-helicase-domain-containing protein [Aspergillus heteromorphus CBS 117.55]PWY91184.1 UvrD-helicase-domain-containing protein [Aspergillus heteromorphus CBS 117.55]
MDPILEGLNSAQTAAVASPSPVLQVLAPPGSGKTKTLTARVAYLLSHHGYRPQDVICCTFTIKASREMRERLAKLIGDDLQRKLVLGTFHSICRRYLVTYGYLIGLKKGFGIADSGDSLAIIKVRILVLVRSVCGRVAVADFCRGSLSDCRSESSPTQLGHAYLTRKRMVLVQTRWLRS